MADNEIQLLLQYIDLLEAELKNSNPEQFERLIQKREGLLPLLRSQRAMIETLRTAHQADQAQLVELQAEIASLRSVSKAQKPAHQDRPSTR
jgi:hypothetical protein